MKRPSLLIAALAAAVPLTIVGRTAAATPSAVGVLTGDTSISWTGVKGISLAMPRRTVAMPAERMKLSVGNDASYALVRMLATNTQTDCPTRVCNVWSLDFFRAFPFGEGLQTGDPRDQHDTTQTDPPTFDPGGRLEVYLMTDGHATLRLLPAGLGGRSSYVAGGGVRGTVRRLSATCPTPACDPTSGYAGRFSFGGATFDIGALGSAESFAFSMASRVRQTTVQSSLVHVCVYPGRDPARSPDPKTHPLGCDPLPSRLSDPNYDLYGTEMELESADPTYTGVAFHYAPSALSGLQYVGYHLGSLGDNRQIREAYGIWYRYTIAGAPRVW